MKMKKYILALGLVSMLIGCNDDLLMNICVLMEDLFM